MTLAQLCIEPARLDWLVALGEGDEVFTEKFGIPVVPGWIGFPEALPHSVLAAEREDADPWGSYLFFDENLGLVGFGGFKGEPRDGTAEIGYAIAPAAQGKGFASAAVAEMTAKARDAGVKVVVAHTLPEENASVSVLRRSEFEHVGEVTDPDGGVDSAVWRWELNLA